MRRALQRGEGILEAAVDTGRGFLLGAGSNNAMPSVA